LDQANEAKVEGNKLFVDGKYEEALSQYEVALQVAPDTPSSVEIRSICHSNRGVCFLKLVWPVNALMITLEINKKRQYIFGELESPLLCSHIYIDRILIQ